MRHHTELSFVDEFRWVSPLHYLKNGWQNAVLLWCMLQAGLPSLHYYSAVVLHSCIVLPPVSHSSNHQYHCCQLTDNRAVFRIFIALLRFSFDSPSYMTAALGSSSHLLLTRHRTLWVFNPLTPNDLYMSRTAPLTSKRCILYVYSTNVGTEYFKHALYSPFFPLQNAVCFIMLTCLVPVLFTFYIQGVLK